ncbi:MAG: cation-translocating P-type ATPase [Deltaproteobacteria bacterium]|nr:cation-translocating P-type ATPase [Deltaproteobacteria bacterium]
MNDPVHVEGHSPRDAGLTTEEAHRRLATSGRNEIRRAAAHPPWLLFFAQFNSPVVWLLLGACVLSALTGEIADAIAIAAIVIANGLVGFFQEYRAERAILALRSMTAPRARVERDGRVQVVAATEIVVGDLLIFEPGDVVAADGSLVEAHALLVNEAPLTGESVPVAKSTTPVDPTAPLAERRDSVFMGTSVSNGTGRARVSATGMKTELGRIAHLLEEATEEPTPLQAQLARTSRVLLFLSIGIVSLVGLLGALRGLPFAEVFLSAVSLAVAAVPEGLPAIVTIALAIGVERMVRRNVLVRRLPAVETLGSASVICTDKTGTLTTGVMKVRELWGADHRRLLDAGAACSDAELNQDESSGIGDPTEIAILLAAAERGIRRSDIENERPRTHVEPFDPERKRMSIGRADGVLYTKGALEGMLPQCSGGTEGAIEANDEMASRGLRVLAVAVGTGQEERRLQLLGLIGIADPPRTEAIEAVALARSAGIRTVMITGDHPVTARAIARELGIVGPKDAPEDVVHARATPEDKLRIVRAWKQRGAIVAMTGDGVNDAPALREAHVGIAMGRTGTEVTREASDVVLTDDNFASIVEGVREGRGIFENIRKALVYLLAGNASELAVMLTAAVLGLPLPLLPLHLLWINLVTDGLPALALVMDPVDPDAMTRSPRAPSVPMLGRPEWLSIAFTAMLQTTVTLGVFAWALERRDLTEARNLAFSVLVFGELLRAFAARSATWTFWEVGAFTNLRLFGIVVVSIALQLGLHHIPATQALFEIGDLPLSDCGLALALGLVPVSMVELSKVVRRSASITFGHAHLPGVQGRP